MNQKLITGPVDEPVTIEEVKEQINLTHNKHDALISRHISAARSHAETFCRRAFITQTWEVRLDDFPALHLELPRGQLQSIESVKYLDINESEQTLATTVYEADTHRDPGRLVLQYDEDWPDALDQTDAVRVRFVCGYGDGSDDMPQPIRQAVMLLATDFYTHRESFVLAPGLVRSDARTAEALLQPYRLLHQ